METSSKIKFIHQILGNSDLLERSGSVLYSGDQTIKDGDWYFLGSNPGGHDDENGIDTIENQLLKIVKDITSKGFVRNNYKKNLVDLSDVKISLKGKK